MILTSTIQAKPKKFPVLLVVGEANKAIRARLVERFSAVQSLVQDKEVRLLVAGFQSVCFDTKRFHTVSH